VAPHADPSALRLAVSSDGPVSVSAEQLAEAGWALADTRTDRVALSSGGQPVAWAVRPADAPERLAQPDGGRLHPGDRIEFVGRAALGPYTRENVYWLQPDGPADLRAHVLERDASPATASGPAMDVYTHTLALERDDVYVTAFRPPGGERWLWGAPIAAGESRSVPLGLPSGARHPAPIGGGEAVVRVALQGYTDDPDLSPDHRLDLRLSGAGGEMDPESGLSNAEAVFDGRSAVTLTARAAFPTMLAFNAATGLIPAEVLSGTLHIDSHGNGAAVDSVFLNRVQADYPARAAFASGAPSWMRIAGLRGDGHLVDAAIRGLAVSTATVLDVANPDLPVILQGLRLAPDPEAPGLFTARFRPAPGGAASPADPAPPLLAWSAGGASPPDSVALNAPGPLSRGTSPSASYIVITHQELTPAARTLVESYRRSGRSAVLLTTDDVYSAHSHGRYHPPAIRSFLQSAYSSWTPAPETVLLFGEANLDHRGGYAMARGGPSPPNRVPSLQVERSDGVAMTSDLPFVDFDGDGVPEIALGRLPAATLAEAEAVVSKLLAFAAARPPAPEISRPAGGWRSRSVLVADDTDAAEMEHAAERLGTAFSRLAPDVTRLFAYRLSPPLDLTAEIALQLDEGALLMAYVGHGNVDTWAPWHGGGRMLQRSDVAALTNAPRLPLLIAATCMVAWFDHPLKPVALGEEWLLNPDGGGVAVLAPTGLARLDDQTEVLSRVLRELADHPHMPLGEVFALAARRAVAADPALGDALRGLALLADPGMALFAPPETPDGATAPPPSGTPTPDDPVREPAYLPAAEAGP